MKKIILLTIACFSMSCSKDDDNVMVMPPTAVAPIYANKITFNYVNTAMNRTYNVLYDNQKRINKIVSTGYVNGVYTLSYNDKNQVSGIAMTGDTPDSITATYDAEGRLSSYSKNVTGLIMVNYDITTQSYNAAGLEYSLNSDKDYTIFGGAFLTYDSTKKGAFTSVGINYQPLSILIANEFLFIASKCAMSSIAVPNFDSAIQTSYNAKGYVETIHITSVSNPTSNGEISFQYQEL